MSEPSSARSLPAAWSWLRPERVLRRAELGTTLWSDLGPAGRARARDLLTGVRPELQAAAPPATLAEGRRQLALRQLERELGELDQLPQRAELAARAAEALGPAALAADPELVLERLERLEELAAPLRSRGQLELAGSREDGRRGARRLRATARQLEQRLPLLLPLQPRPGLQGLLTLADELEHALPHETPAPDRAWRELEAEAGWSLAQLLERVESELGGLAADLEKRAETLRQRYLGATPAEGPALPWLRGQFALDPPRPEHWAWLHNRHLQDISRHLVQLGLEHERPAARVQPGLEPDWPCPGPDEAGEGLALPDLSLLDLARLEALLAEHHHGQLAVSAAREGLPGRLWLLRRIRGQELSDPAAGVLAALTRPADLDVWARWAGAWLPRSGWLAGDARLRLLSRLADWRDLCLTRADLERRLAMRPEAEIRHRLERESGLPPLLAEAAWQHLLREPGREALASARLFDLQEAGRRWRRQQRGSAADLFRLSAEAALLPGSWLRAHFAAQPGAGRQWHALPPALVKPVARPELLGEVEERLAALGRIQREDLEAGREFDAPGAAAAAPDEEAGEPAERERGAKPE
ncbi:MAG: hypothetical protein WC326_00825 [Candidatus Delongbacteria bacterium]